MDLAVKTGTSFFKKIVKLFALLLLLYFIFFLLPLGISIAYHQASSSQDTPWWGLRRDSSQQAPDPAFTSDAVIQVYAARAARWRGAFGVHTWIATKKSHENSYKRIEVMGYGVRWSGRSVRISSGRPDSYWYGNRPWLLRELSGGSEVDQLIDQLHHQAANYPFDSIYKVWPGPNSNTFIAWLARQAPELRIELPVTAIGKDYLPSGHLFTNPASGQGVQFSIGGLAGLLISPEEGIEINILGLTAGLDINPPAIKLPGLGRFGLSDFKRIN